MARLAIYFEKNTDGTMALDALLTDVTDFHEDRKALNVPSREDTYIVHVDGRTYIGAWWD